MVRQIFRIFVRIIFFLCEIKLSHFCWVIWCSTDFEPSIKMSLSELIATMIATDHAIMQHAVNDMKTVTALNLIALGINPFPKPFPKSFDYIDVSLYTKNNLIIGL